MIQPLPADAAARTRDWVVLAFVCAGLLLGGSSRNVPLFIAVVQLAAVIALAAVALTAGHRGIDRRVRLGIGFALLLLVTVVVQLLPLPPELWRALSGRETSTAVRDLAGASERHLPLSLDPDATRAAGLALLPPLAAFFGTAAAGASARLRLMLAVLVVAILDLLLSVLQFSTRGDAGLAFYDTLHASSALGLFANRNHNADLLLIAPLLAAAYLKVAPSPALTPIRRPAMLILLVIFLLGVLIASSRAGLALAIIPVAAVLVLFASRPASRLPVQRSGRALSIPILATTAALVVGIAVLGSTNNVARRIFARFGASDDQRFSFWPDVVYAVQQYWPIGSGLGSFPDVFRSVERLNIVGEFYINHAHNEYLELLLEVGLWGAVLVLLFLILFVVVGGRHFVRRRGQPIAAIALAASAGIVLMLLHSLVDYPLRTPALAILFGMLSGLLLDPARGRANPPVGPAKNGMAA